MERVNRVVREERERGRGWIDSLGSLDPTAAPNASTPGPPLLVPGTNGGFFHFKNQQSSLDNHRSIPRKNSGTVPQLAICLCVFASSRETQGSPARRGNARRGFLAKAPSSERIGPNIPKRVQARMAFECHQINGTHRGQTPGELRPKC